MGLSQGNGDGPGLSGGRASGARPPGTPEENTFKRERHRPKELSRGGRAVGRLFSDDPSPTGEAAISLSSEFGKALQERAEEVDREPLPVEHKEHVERFHELLLKPRSGE